MGELDVRQDVSIVDNVRELGAELLPNGLILNRDITPEQFEALMWYLALMHESLRWAIGDGEFQGETIFGDDVYQYLEITGMSKESQRQYFRVAGDVPLERRRTELTWSHHRAVAPLDADDQVMWLQRAVENRWTKQELEAHIREWRGISEKPRRPYVVEQVCDAAEHIWDAAVQVNDGGFWQVPNEAMNELSDALGVVD